MISKKILKETLQLRPAERLRLIEILSESLNKPDKKVEKIWAEESEKRYKALTEEKVRTFKLNEIIQRYK